MTQLREEIYPEKYRDIRDFFLSCLEDLKKQNPRGFTLGVVSHKTGLSKSYLSSVFKGQKKLSFEAANKLAIFLGIDEYNKAISLYCVLREQTADPVLKELLSRVIAGISFERSYKCPPAEDASEQELADQILHPLFRFSEALRSHKPELLQDFSRAQLKKHLGHLFSESTWFESLWDATQLETSQKKTPRATSMLSPSYLEDLRFLKLLLTRCLESPRTYAPLSFNLRFASLKKDQAQNFMKDMEALIQKYEAPTSQNSNPDQNLYALASVTMKIL